MMAREVEIHSRNVEKARCYCCCCSLGAYHDDGVEFDACTIPCHGKERKIILCRGFREYFELMEGGNDRH